jgi:hypothetical protein
MYATYKYNAGATKANILSDVVAICTGTTDKNTLSSSCDKPNTEILTTYSTAGWTLHDATAGTNAIAIKAPLEDDATKYKYVVIDTNTTNTIFTKVYENWNASTDVGTNPCALNTTTSVHQVIDTTNGGYLRIAASERMVLFYSSTGTYPYGNPNNNALSGCIEASRIMLWDTVANGYPCFGLLCKSSVGNYLVYQPVRSYAAITNTDYTSFSDQLKVGNLLVNADTGTPWGFSADENKTLSVFFMPIYASGYSALNIGVMAFDLSCKTNTYTLGLSQVLPLSEGEYNGENYISWTFNGQTAAFMVKKG